jgi:superfamily I DNA/RNA helicase
MALRPTEEQLRAVEAYRSGQDLKVVAVAGSGKTIG